MQKALKGRGITEGRKTQLDVLTVMVHTELFITCVRQRTHTGKTL